MGVLVPGSELRLAGSASDLTGSGASSILRLMTVDSGHDGALHWVGKALRRKWHLDALIGTGGMANVYAATHRNGRRGAIKLLKPELNVHAEVRERFLREGYVANRIQHPGLVGIVDDDETEDGLAFLVMELLSGESLQDRLARDPAVPPAEALFIADQVLDVLQAAHEAQVVHRDIKPGNIFVLDDGRVKLLDLGLARVLEGRKAAVAMTQKGMVLGTVPFMAPEQAQGKPELVTAQSDIYALGATLFFVLSGQYVHEHENKMDRLLATMRDPARSLARAADGIPSSVVRVVDRALAFRPRDRWGSAAEMQEAVRGAYEELAQRPIPKTRRVCVQGVQGWVRPVHHDAELATEPMTAASLSISVVFEADLSQGVASVPIDVDVSEDA